MTGTIVAGRARNSSWLSKMSLMDRFMMDVSMCQITGCWIWMGTWDPHGYGKLMVCRRPLRAHRVAYELFVGPLKEGLQIDHLCRVRCCCNPAHLEQVTPKVNTHRSLSTSAMNARKVACKRGHPFDRVDGQGRRYCSQCRPKDMREAYMRMVARRKEAKAIAEARGSSGLREQPTIVCHRCKTAHHLTAGTRALGGEVKCRECGEIMISWDSPAADAKEQTK